VIQLVEMKPKDMDEYIAYAPRELQVKLKRIIEEYKKELVWYC